MGTRMNINGRWASVYKFTCHYLFNEKKMPCLLGLLNTPKISLQKGKPLQRVSCI